MNEVAANRTLEMKKKNIPGLSSFAALYSEGERSKISLIILYQQGRVSETK